MPRQTRATDPDDQTTVKEERVKQEGARSKGKGKRRAEVEEVPDEEAYPQATQGEEDAEGDEDEEGESGSPRGTKRMRVNGDGDSRPGGSGSQDDAPPLPKVKTLPRDTDGYIPGSIVRIQLKNFVTYDYVQFCPGPYLNMILGPNGTGKSSIACAIALGLNFPPTVLGRALELNAFVKNGTTSGYIEIELKGPKNKGNYVVRRNLSAISRTSTFTLNGVAATGTEIKNKMSELNVQVGNLCSFLPQDKVSEFAGMSPQELLKETQRAAGDENLTKWHDTLITTGTESRKLLQTIKDEEESLRQMQERNEGIERDVQRYKERQKIEHDIALVNVLLPVAEYRDIRQRYIDTKEEQRKLHAKVQRLKDRNAPAHALLKKFEGNLSITDKERDNLKKLTMAKFKKLGERGKANEKLDGETEDVQTQLIALKNEEKNRLRNIKDTERDISMFEREIAKPPPPNLSTLEALREETKAIAQERNVIHERRDEINRQTRQNIEKKTKLKYTYDSACNELKKQDNADVQKLRMMYNWDRDTHDAILWLRDHKHLFRMEVFETPFMCLAIKDKRYNDSVEACFGANQLKTFIAQCQEDCDIINHHINDEGALGRKARVTTWFRPRQDNFIIPPPMSREELHELGFDGYAMNYVDYPPGMEWFLMRDINLHRTAIALNGNRVDVNKAMEYVARPIDGSHSGGASFINGSTMNTVSRSRYGKRAVTNITKDVQKARNLVIPTIDPELKRQLDETIQSTAQDMDMCDVEKKELNEANAKVGEEDKVYEARNEDVTRKKQAIHDEQKRVATANNKLHRAQQKLKGLINKPPVEKQAAALRRKLMEITNRRTNHVKECSNLIHAIVAEQAECTRVGLQYLQIGANKGALQELCDRKDEKYQTAMAEWTKVNDLFQTIKAQSKQVLATSRAIVEDAPPEIRDEYQEIEAVRLQYEKDLKEAVQNGTAPPDRAGVELRVAEDLRADLETLQAKLEMNLNTNPGVVEQYEKRKRDIEQLEKTIEGRKKQSDKLERNIKSARDNWQPALEKLVASIGEKFSAAFDRIGCAGEIRISQHEEYEKWAIDILVKFRDSEKLQLLTAHRQSGGERSLTTILYLMSLTEEARAPFSLVDEINQGMDQRAERVVHNSMVEVTCKADSAQYFLITPKLLPDLNYHERMKVLCVNNGEWLPEEKNIGNMMKMVDGYVAARNNGPGEM